MIKHLHHILPRHAGGTDDPSNLMEVSVEEHAELHLTLYLEHGRWQDWYAFHLLSGTHPGGWNKGLSRPEHSKLMSGEGNPMWGKVHPNRGIPRTEEVKAKISASKKGTVFSEEHRKKLSDKAKKQSNRARTYELIFSNGEVLVVRNLKQWCSGNSYTPGSIRLLCNGEKDKYKDIVSARRITK